MKMKQSIPVLAALVLSTSSASAMDRAFGFCEQGNQTIQVLGYQSSAATPVQASCPGATITVYITGSGGTKASIYSDNGITPLANPFTIGVSPETSSIGYWFFYAANGTYDVQFSGAGVATPFTLGAYQLFDIANYVPPPCGTDQQVQYNRMGVFGCDANFTWNYTAQTLNLNGNIIAQGISGASGEESEFYRSITSPVFIPQAAMIIGVNGVGVENIGTGPRFLFSSSNSAGATSFLGSLAAIWQNPLAGEEQGSLLLTVRANSADTGAETPAINISNNTTTIYGLTGLPALVTAGGGFVDSSGGFLSTANLWNSFQSLTDGALMRGYGLAQNAATNANGGYFDAAPLTYNPYDSGSVCMDAYGNPVVQPLPLNGLSAFGANDVILWVGNSPSMPPSGSCGAPLTVQENYGLLSNGYSFFRGGVATDNGSYNAISTYYLSGGAPAGGLTTGSVTAGTLYPAGTLTTTGTLPSAMYLGGYMAMGHSTGPPASGTIATTTNPLTGGDGLEPGTFYFNDTAGEPEYYGTDSAWHLWGGGGGGSGCTLGTTRYSIQINDPVGTCYGDSNFLYTPTTTPPTVTLSGDFVTNTTTGGFDAESCTAFNCIQAPVGGISAELHTFVERAAPSASGSGLDTCYGDSTAHIPECSSNGGSYYKLAMWSGALVNGDCAQIAVTSSFPTLVDAGAACGGGGGSGTVTSSAEYNIPYYSTNPTGTTVAGSNLFAWNPTSTPPQVSLAGVYESSTSTGGFNATVTTAYNSIQTTGGFLATTGYSFVCGSAPALSGSGFARMYCDSTNSLEVSFNGGAYAPIGGSSGVSSITGTANEVLANGMTGTPVVGAITLTLPQAIAVGSSPTFAGVTTPGAFESTATGTSIAFQVNSGTFQVNGAGAVSGAGVFSSTGSSGGFNVTADVAANSIQTTGGFNACDTASCTGGIAIEVDGTEIVSSSRAATFATVTSTGAIDSNSTGTAISFQNGNGNFQVNGNGALSIAGALTTDGGVNVVDTALNSVQSSGSANMCNSGTAVSSAAYQADGVTVINCSGVFTAPNGINTTGGATFGSAVAMNGGMTTMSGTNSTLYIGTGALYLFTFTGGAPSCTGITNAWFGLNITSQEFYTCIGGVEYHSAPLTTP
jgi:hypothetical protein